MQQVLQLFILIPLAGFFISLLIPRKDEKTLSLLSIAAVSAQLISLCVFSVYWLMNNHITINVKQFVLYKTDSFEFFIGYYFDKISAAYMMVGAVIMLLVIIFSRTYLHRESGFKRFFNTILFFYLGYNIIILSGNFETLFIGWEILGICSFLLIGFYRDRYLPVKNALKVIFVYRLGDICLVLAMWMCHHLWHENITFLKLSSPALLNDHTSDASSLGLFISIMIITAAAAKSAQLPFSSWLPRAMEGPTTSSAIFYGSLSVHLGAFLLLRTYPLWEQFISAKVLIIAIGAATSVIATSIARVQSTVKTQIAYASVTQIGLIFIEVALGFHTIALIHFAGNAFLRTYQLLVSPSVLSYLGHDMFFNFKARKENISNPFIKKLRNSFYILSTKEFNLDFLIYRLLWDPFKWIGRTFSFLSTKISIILLLVILAAGVFIYLNENIIPADFNPALPILFSLISLLLILNSFSERACARKSWGLVVLGQFYLTISILLNEAFSFNEALLYLSGILISGIVGFICLNKIKSIDNDIHLNRFHGYVYEKPKIAMMFFICCLGLLAFPITPTFLGIDLLFTHIHKDQYALVIFTSISIIFIELTVLRIYARVFLGQHKKAYHPIAYKSS